MRRRRRVAQPGGPAVSLFPFLAVLICTMGGLIVLLVMVVQQASVQAQVVAESEAANDRQKQVDQLKLALEDQQWRHGELAKARDEKSRELADGRLELGHLETHLRELAAQWDDLIAQAEQLEQVQDGRAEDRARLAAEQDRLQTQLAEARRELQLAQDKLAKKPQAFAIVPYDGPNGTRRRPIYLECTADGVTLYPERVTLPVSDFEGPMGPGNPLAAVLRAVREHHHQSRMPGEPYPLLVVRPDGAQTYNLARAAMKSWDDEFGYELIGADLKLEFPPANPELAATLQTTIAEARRRQEILAAAMPGRFKSGRGGAGGRTSRPAGLVASSRGGFVASGGGSSRFGGGSRSLPGSPTSPPQPSRDQRAESTQNRDPHSSPSQAGRTPSGQPRQPGQPTPPNAPPPTGGGSSRPSHLAAGGSRPGSPGASGMGGVQSMAGSRGANWALPNGGNGATGVTRPVRVRLTATQLVIVPERGERQAPKVIQLTGSTSGHVDEFVSQLWKHIEGWGLALAGGYWKPVLRVEVVPGGEQRFRELQVLLHDSGVLVANGPTPRPPVRRP